VDDLEPTGNPTTKTNAAAVLKQAGSRIIPELMKFLTDKKVDPRRRGNSAVALGYAGTKSGPEVEVLLAALKDDQSKVRYSAVYALTRLKVDHRQLAPIYTELLTDPDSQVRRAAAAGLGSMGAVAANAIPRLEKLDHDESEQTRQIAATALQKIKDSMPANDPMIKGRPLTAWVDDLDPRDTITQPKLAVETLQHAGPEIVEELIDRLKNSHGTQRHRGNVALALGYVGKNDGPEAQALLDALNNRDSYVVFSAIYSLRRIQVDAHRLVPLFIERLEAANKTVRRAAAENLGLLGEPAKPAIPALTAHTNDEAQEVRDAVKTALNRIKN
jgi:HEAT repeat protein